MFRIFPKTKDPKKKELQKTVEAINREMAILNDVKEQRKKAEEEIKQLIRVKDSSGKAINLVEDEKSIIHYLPLTLKVIRLYAVGIDEKKAEEIRSEVKGRLQNNS